MPAQQRPQHDAQKVRQVVETINIHNYVQECRDLCIRSSRAATQRGDSVRANELRDLERVVGMPLYDMTFMFQADAFQGRVKGDWVPWFGELLHYCEH